MENEKVNVVRKVMNEVITSLDSSKYNINFTHGKGIKTYNLLKFDENKRLIISDSLIFSSIYTIMFSLPLNEKSITILKNNDVKNNIINALNKTSIELNIRFDETFLMLDVLDYCFKNNLIYDDNQRLLIINIIKNLSYEEVINKYELKKEIIDFVKRYDKIQSDRLGKES